MALDTYSSIWGKVLLRCPTAGAFLARDWVSNSFRRLAERRSWSWLIKQGQFILNASHVTGTVTVTRSSITVTGAATGWTAPLVGRQFRVGANTPIYTIATVDVAAQTLTLDLPWGGATASTKTYEIYNAYVTVPSDFNYFLTIWDPSYNWQLHRNISQTEINTWDAQRSNRGQAYVVAPRDWYGGYPRYEVWPHIVSDYVIPMLYVARAEDLQDSGATLPRYIRGDALLEMALAEAARWPGASEERPNPYFNLNLAKMHDGRAEFMINELERQDEEISIMNVSYQSATQLPWAPIPVDAAYWQKHAF
jgi:hypothetical protein